MAAQFSFKNFILFYQHIFYFTVYYGVNFVQTLQSTNVDLFQILKPFERYNCYAILRNYWNLDYSHSNNIPIVAQHFVTKTIFNGFYTKAPYWFPSKFWWDNYSNFSASGNDTMTCSSKYFVDKLDTRNSDSFQTEVKCLSINMSTWSVVGRPSTCKIMLDYVMPTSVFNRNDANKVRYPSSDYSIAASASLLPEITICIMCPWRILRQWLVAVAYVPSTVFMKNILFFYVTHGSSGQSLQKYYAISPFDATHIPIANEHWQSRIFLAPVHAERIGSQLIIWKNGWRENILTRPRFTMFLRRCVNSDQLEEIVLGKSQEINKIEKRRVKLYDAFAHVVQTIMGNFTYQLNFSTSCTYPGVTSSGGGKESLPEEIRMYVFETPTNLTGDYMQSPSLKFNDPFAKLRFVACGVRDRGRWPMSLSLLTGVFDTSIWMWLLITTVAICITIYSIENNMQGYRLSSFWVRICKVFLEQSDPFPNITEVRFQLKFILVSLLFGSLVISNAYKSSNLYKMTRPRKPMTFETLEKLKAANYTLYTRMNVGDIETRSKDPKQWVHRLRGNWTTRRFREHVLTSRQTGPTIKVYTRSDLLDPLEFKEHSELILKLRKSVPNSLKAVQETFDNFVNNNQLAKLRSVNELRKTFSNWQKEKLLHSLRTCQRAAVLLPEHNSERYRKLLQQEGKAVYISKQQLSRKPNGVSFAGLVTRSFLIKVGGVHNSGIINRWEKLYSFSLHTWLAFAQKRYEAVKLSGSFILIFKLLIIGNVVALAVCLLEKAYKIVSIRGCKKRKKWCVLNSGREVM